MSQIVLSWLSLVTYLRFNNRFYKTAPKYSKLFCNKFKKKKIKNTFSSLDNLFAISTNGRKKKEYSHNSYFFYNVKKKIKRKIYSAFVTVQISIFLLIHNIYFHLTWLLMTSETFLIPQTIFFNLVYKTSIEHFLVFFFCKCISLWRNPGRNLNTSLSGRPSVFTSLR